MIAGAVLAAALLTAGAPGAVAFDLDPQEHTVTITDAGKQNLPEQWFVDSVVMPGDAGTRTIVLENGRSVDTTVTVRLRGTDLAAAGGLGADLQMEWDGGSGTLAEVISDSPSLADQVVLEPGDRLPITLSYSFPESATQVHERGSTSNFVVAISAFDTHDLSGGGDGGAGGGGGGAGGGGATDGGLSLGGGLGGLASTGAQVSGPWLFGLLSLLVGWFLVAARRRRREDSVTP